MIVKTGSCRLYIEMTLFILPRFTVSLLFFLIPCLLHAQDLRLQEFQRAVTKGVALSAPAAVKLFDYDEKLGKRNTMGSGVVVSADGRILTVAHVNVPGKTFVVQFPDGTEVKAKGLGEITSIDAAMMQITEKGNYPYAPVGRSENLRDRQPCISLSYAGSLRTDQPYLRLGFIVKSENPNRRRRNLQTTCLMEPGDSGGPVFDLDGRVIGVHSNIQGPLDANFEVPVDEYLKYWDVLSKEDQEYQRAPDSLAIKLDALSAVQSSVNIPFSDTCAYLMDALGKANARAYLIQSKFNDSTVSALGTLIQLTSGFPEKMKKGKSFFISKNSIIHQNPKVYVNEKKTVTATVVARDKERDLVLLAIDVKLKQPAFDLTVSPDSLSKQETGTFLASPLANGKAARMSVAGRIPYAISGVSKAGYFGAALERRDDGLFVRNVNENSPAKANGLERGMRVLRLDHNEVSSPEEFVKLIQMHKPGDTVQIEVSLNSEILTKDIVLGVRPMANSGHIAERFEGGKSAVRDGFSRVFPHDGRLRPDECGGPLVDLQGRLIGINIARLSRTSSLAVPVDELKQFLKSIGFL